jgi:hypothetical protein
MVLDETRPLQAYSGGMYGPVPTTLSVVVEQVSSEVLKEGRKPPRGFVNWMGPCLPPKHTSLPNNDAGQVLYAVR